MAAAWIKGPLGHIVDIYEVENLHISGVIIRGSYGWTIVPRKSENVVVRNVKLCNGRVQNDDGINPVNSRNVLIEDCFIRSDDDCIALKGFDNAWGNVENITVRDCVLWSGADHAAGA